MEEANYLFVSANNLSSFAVAMTLSDALSSTFPLERSAAT
jgi:hypothetical protein